jgi:hypothetical protein
VSRLCSKSRLLGLIAWAALWTARLHAQSVSPPIAEYQGKARSSFQLQNASIFPITVVLEVRGFTISDRGDVVDVPLDTGRIHVKLSEMSFRLAPRSAHTVFYEATSDSLPTWFNILSALSGARTSTGLNVRILLPHVVYLSQKQPLRKEEVAIRGLEYDLAAKKAWVELENLSPNLGRVQQLVISDGRITSETGGGFPLLPRRLRRAMVNWDGTKAPTRLSLRFSRFSIDTTLTPVPATLAADTAAGTPRP